MTEEMLSCPDCTTGYEAADNYCRTCGMYLAVLKPLAPTPLRPRALEPLRPSLPAPVRKVATAIVVGSALQVGLGLAGRYLARQAAGKALDAARPGRKTRAVQVAQPAPVPVPLETEAVSETLVIRRVWVKRG
ncbi:MAG: hypothetical protein ACR2HN_01205 [Tepidiformaceae bacterium]